jgi:hypothetical protein
MPLNPLEIQQSLLRLTFHNRKEESESDIVTLMIWTYAHEVAHELHPVFVLNVGPQGRLISEGSADFLRLVTLLQAGLIDEARVKADVSRAYDECRRRRGSSGLIDRLTSRSAHFREYYDCGAIYYFALMFEWSADNTDGQEVRFVADLSSALQGLANREASATRCVFVQPGCDKILATSMLGDAESLAKARGRFDVALDSFLTSRPTFRSQSSN